MTIPNMLTIFRLLLLPLLFAVFYWDFNNHYFVAAVIFTVIGVTDFFDGYLARRLNQFSKLGAFLDPVADKIAVALSYILIVELYQNPWVTLAVTIIIGREIAISALREWMAGAGESNKTAVANIGKWKTFFQMFAIGAMFVAAEHYSIIFDYAAFACLFVATVLTLVSMVHYFQQAWRQLSD